MPRAKLLLGFCAILFFAQGQSKSVADITSDDPDSDYDDDVDYEGEKPKVIVLTQPQTFRTHVGDNVIFPCEAENTENTILIWMTDKGPVGMRPQDTPLVPDKRFSTDKNFNLMLRNVTEKDFNKTYTCIISDNPPINIVHQLLKKEENEPAAYITPSHSVIQKGDSLTLTCNINNKVEDKVTFKWSHDGNWLQSEQHSRSSSVTINNATRANAGVYSCIADNGAPTPLHASTNVIVEYLPEVSQEHKMVHSGININSHLTCVVHANPPAKVTWMFNHTELQNSAKYKMHSKKSKHILTIHNTQRSDLGDYVCKGENSLGEGYARVKLEGTPSQPTVHKGEIDSNNNKTFIITWRMHSYLPIEEYQLQFRRKGETEWKRVNPSVMAEGKDHTFTVRHPVEDLQSGHYEAMFSAKNDYGWSPTSFIYTFSLDELQTEAAKSSENSIYGISREVQGSGATSHVNTITATLLILASFVYSNL